MELVEITTSNMEECQKLFQIAFMEDKYYEKAGYDLITNFPEDFKTAIERSLSSGKSIGFKDDTSKIIAIALVFDYKKTLVNHRDDFDKIFGIMCNSTIIPYNDEIHKPIAHLKERTILYVLSIAVDPQHRRKHIGTSLIEHIIQENPEAAIVGDVSSMESMPIYRRLGFEEYSIEDDYMLIIKTPK